MTIKKKLFLFCGAVLIIPIGIILILLRVIHYQSQWLDILSVELERTPPPSLMSFVMNNYNILVAAIVIVGLIAILAAGFAFLRSIVNPLKMLTKSASNIEKGDLDSQIYYSNADEFSTVFEQFDRMRVRFKDLLWQQIKEEQDRTELITNISHDLKTPITSIRGYAQGIIDRVAQSPEQQQKYLKTIIAKANDLNKMADTLYTLAKLGSKQLMFNIEQLPALEVIQEIAAEASMGRSELRLTTKIDLQPETKISIDLAQTERVVSNIIENSIKYKRNDVVNMEISAYEDDYYVVFGFADDGIGIPSDELDKVFERFYRNDQARQNTSNGSGLGLSIAKQIMESQNGYIWARGNSNHGLTILLSFPKEEV